MLLAQQQPKDSINQVVCVAQTFGTDSMSLSTKVDFYTDRWVKLDSAPELSVADRKRVDALNLQTIVNWAKKTLKKD
jgi:hypothetical protein